MRAAGPGGACGRSACVAGRAKARRATASLNAANRSWTSRYESHAARQGGGAQSFAPLLEPQLPYRQHWENHPQGLILMKSSLTNNTEATAIRIQVDPIDWCDNCRYALLVELVA